MGGYPLRFVIREKLPAKGRVSGYNHDLFQREGRGRCGNLLGIRERNLQEIFDLAFAERVCMAGAARHTHGTCSLESCEAGLTHNCAERHTISSIPRESYLCVRGLHRSAAGA